jgi:hypothetical protein
MPMQSTLRMFVFIVFFSIGAAAMSISILCDELLRYYHNKQALNSAQESTERLKSLNDDYDVLLEQMKDDPNFINRALPVTLGIEANEPNTIHPKATAEQLAAAKEALTADVNDKTTASLVPDWLNRCSEPRRRAVLFVTGAVLILISFMYFGPAKKSFSQKK